MVGSRRVESNQHLHLTIVVLRCSCLHKHMLLYSPRVMASLEIQVAESLPSSPHQPQSFTYPKRAFGKKTVVYRSFQIQWYRSWSWLHYQEPNYSVLCYLCSKAIRQNKMRPSIPDSAFVSYKTSYLTRAYNLIII